LGVGHCKATDMEVPMAQTDIGTKSNEHVLLSHR
jgi:hypothetical protein